MKELPESLLVWERYPQFILANKEKVPVDLYGQRVNFNDPVNWMSATEACGYSELLGYGVGFVFTENDPFWFLDLDHCIVDGKCTDIANTIIDMFPGAAIEISTSGDGLHIYGCATVPPHGCKNAEHQIELYTEGRYALLTGNEYQDGDVWLDWTQTITPLAEQWFPKTEAGELLDWTDQPDPDWNGPDDDDVLISRILNQQHRFGNRASPADLWNNNEAKLAPAYPPFNENDPYDRSSADMGLALHLAWWTGKNHTRIWNLMWRSGLVRKKWDPEGKHKNYLADTIVKAVNRCGESVYNQKYDQKNKLDPLDFEAERARYISTLESAVSKLKAGHASAHWDSSVVSAASELLQHDPVEFYRKRNEIKLANPDSQITDWTRAVKAVDDSDERNSSADLLVQLVRDQCELFHDNCDRAYATFQQNGHYETWDLNSKGFEKWLSYKAFSELGITPAQATYSAVISTLIGFAIHEGTEQQVYLRTAPIEDGYLIDQTNDNWSALEVTKKGWRVVSQPEKKFIRSSTASPLPDPVDGDFDLLWSHVNIPDHDKSLVTAFIVESWRPETPYTILEMSGEQGCAKSTTHARIRQIIDPNQSPLRTAPKDTQDIFVSAGNNHMASFENMSNLAPKMQDALCTLTTGGGFAARKLYSDADESVIEVKRPIMINGINAVATRPDLIDRVIHIDLPRILNYESAVKLECKFEADLPMILGGLLSVFSRALSYLPNIEIAASPRMTDFVLLGEAIHQALDIRTPFRDMFLSNRSAGLQRSLDASPAAMAVLNFIDDRGEFTGTFKELKTILDSRYHYQNEGWPKSVKGLSETLRRSSPALREFGIEIKHLGHKRDGAHVLIRKMEKLENEDHNSHNVTGRPEYQVHKFGDGVTV